MGVRTRGAWGRKSSGRDSSRLWVGAGEVQLLQETEEERKGGCSASANDFSAIITRLLMIGLHR